MKKTTIKDIAQYLNITPATVSYVINNRKEKVSVEMFEKVNNAIKILNYIPNYNARGLVKNESRLIGLFIPQTEDKQQLLLDNPFYSQIITGVELKARQNGYHLIVAGVDKGSCYIDLSTQRNLDGAIIVGIYNDETYSELKKIKKPIVLIDSYVEDDYFYKIGINDEQAGYLATSHLIKNGHRNIAVVLGGIKKDGVIEKRFIGYKRALAENNITLNPNNVFEGFVGFEFGYSTGKLIAKNYPDVTAVFSTADIIAAGVMRGINESGKKVPKDISLIGIDDLYISAMLDIPLTTIKQDIVAKGETAFEILLNVIEEKSEITSKNIILPIELLERKTVRNINEIAKKYFDRS